MNHLTHPAGEIRKAFQAELNVVIKHTQVLTVLALYLGYRVHGELQEFDAAIDSCVTPCIVLQPHIGRNALRKYLGTTLGGPDTRVSKAIKIIQRCLALIPGVKVFIDDEDFAMWYGATHMLNSLRDSDSFVLAEAHCSTPLEIYCDSPDWLLDFEPLMERRKDEFWSYQYEGEVYPVSAEGKPDRQGDYVIVRVLLLFARAGGTVIDLDKTYMTNLSASANRYDAGMGGQPISRTYY